MTALSDRESAYIAAYLEFWPRPYDWDDAGLASPVSSFAPVRTWLAELTTGLHRAELRRAMRQVARKIPKGSPLDPIRTAYFGQLRESREDRLRDSLSRGACVYCGNTGAVHVAAWTDRAGRTRVISPRRPTGIAGRLHEAEVACSCVAGDDAARRGGWSQETRRRFVSLRVSRSEFLALCDQVRSLPQDAPDGEEIDDDAAKF